MPLVQLTYHSRRCHETPQEGARVLAEVLPVATMRNRRSDLTGCLTYTESEFLQILEGEEEAVRALLRKLQRDRRHSDMTVLNMRPVRGRSFHQWSMAGVNFADAAPSLRTFGLKTEMHLSAMPPSLALLVLMDIADRALRNGPHIPSSSRSAA